MRPYREYEFILASLPDVRPFPLASLPADAIIIAKIGEAGRGRNDAETNSALGPRAIARDIARFSRNLPRRSARSRIRASQIRMPRVQSAISNFSPVSTIFARRYSAGIAGDSHTPAFEFPCRPCQPRVYQVKI